jgi:hypothetical protein
VGACVKFRKKFLEELESGEQDTQNSYTQAVDEWIPFVDAVKAKAAELEGARGKANQETAASLAWRKRQCQRLTERRSLSPLSDNQSLSPEPAPSIITTTVLPTNIPSTRGRSSTSTASLSRSHSRAQSSAAWPRKRQRNSDDKKDEKDSKFIEAFVGFTKDYRESIQNKKESSLKEVIELKKELSKSQSNVVKLKEEVRGLKEDLRIVNNNVNRILELIERRERFDTYSDS